MKAENVHKSDRVFLAGEWLTVLATAFVKHQDKMHYNAVKLWFSDNTNITVPRDYELRIS